jgi:MoaA/NifB/PqqE/SkfB family radical SAM enzyme
MTFCPLAWNNLSVIPEGFAPCCWFMYHWKMPDQKNDLLHSKEFQEIRNKMLAGEKVEQCRQCYKNEELGIQSKRQIAIEKYGTSVPEIKLKGIDICFDNICNLKCRGCNSRNSHLWKKDEELIYGRSLTQTKLIENNIDINVSDIEDIEISGGEPFLSNKFFAFFDKIRNNLQNKNLSIVTNGTILLSDDIIQDFKKCKHFKLSISIDGLKETHNYFRSGNVYDTVIQNLEIYYNEFKDLSNTKVEVITTVNVYNVHELNDIKKELSKFNIIWTIKPLEEPATLSIKNLPKEYKDKIQSFVKIEHIHNYLKEDADIPFDLFLDYHDKLDKVRNEKMPDSIFLEFINEIRR